MDALARQTRRDILLALLHRESVTQASIVAETAGLSDDPLDVQVSLHHVHLPTLVDHGFVDWEEDETISRGPTFEQIEHLLTLLDEHRDELPDEWL